MRLLRWLRFWGPYAWPAPVTVLALPFVLACLLSGGRVAVVVGVVEASGGCLTRLLGRRVAVTLGHVVLGRSPRDLEAVRWHERWHVGQFERWGLLLLVAAPWLRSVERDAAGVAAAVDGVVRRREVARAIVDLR